MTLLEIDNILKSYIDTHYGINTYYSHLVKDYDNQNIKYPLLYVEYGDPVLNEGSIDFNITCNFLDLLSESGDNDLDVLSRMLITINNFKVNFIQLDNKDYYIANQNITARKIRANFDNAIGYAIDFTLNTASTVLKENNPVK